MDIDERLSPRFRVTNFLTLALSLSLKGLLVVLFCYCSFDFSFFTDVVEEDGMSAVECFAESNRMASGVV